MKCKDFKGFKDENKCLMIIKAVYPNVNILLYWWFAYRRALVGIEHLFSYVSHSPKSSGLCS